MTLFTAILLYIVIWWMVLFTVLPFGVRHTETPEPGHETGAPERPRLWLKAAVTTAIATVIFAVCYWVISERLITI